MDVWRSSFDTLNFLSIISYAIDGYIVQLIFKPQYNDFDGFCVWRKECFESVFGVVEFESVGDQTFHVYRPGPDQ
jgi:hypothetical protein